MEAAHSPAPDAQAALLPLDGERRCLATGEVLAKGELLRFVVGPDAQVVPDLAQNLPGRGLWVKADHAAVTLAAQKGLFAKAAKGKAKADPALADQVIQLLRARCLSFAGMAKGAGVAVLGQVQVETALRERKIGLLLRAPDAGDELPNHQNLPEYRLFSRDELGQALGYAQIVYAGFRPHGLTVRLLADLLRLAKLVETAYMTQRNG